MFDAPSLIAAAGDHVTLDASLGRGRLVELALALRNLSPSNISVATLPTTETRENGVFYLIADQPAADEAIAAFNGTAAISASVEPLMIKVLNGNGEKGQATEWGAFLERAGFDVETVGDADSFEFATTIVTVRPGDISQAQEIVDALGFGIVEPGTVPKGLDAIVIVGLDALGSG